MEYEAILGRQRFLESALREALRAARPGADDAVRFLDWDEERRLNLRVGAAPAQVRFSQALWEAAATGDDPHVHAALVAALGPAARELLAGRRVVEAGGPEAEP